MRLNSKAVRKSVSTAGFSIPEVLMALAVFGMSVGGVVSGYILSSKQAHWAACVSSANVVAMQRSEQARAARWDPLASPAIDDLTASNFPTAVQGLNMPSSSTNMVLATNYTTITTVSVTPPVRMIRTDCVWQFMSDGLFTNTIISYRSPDQ